MDLFFAGVVIMIAVSMNETILEGGGSLLLSASVVIVIAISMNRAVLKLRGSCLLSWESCLLSLLIPLLLKAHAVIVCTDSMNGALHPFGRNG